MFRFCLWLLLALPIFAQGITNTFTTLTAAGATSWFDTRQRGAGAQVYAKIHTVQLVVTSTPSACSITLDGSLNGTLAANLASASDCTTVRWFNVVDKPTRYVRANLATLTATTKTVTDCTNASPIEVTTSASHGLTTGDLVTITGVVGNTACNVTASAITVTAADKFTVAVAGNGAYVSGGTAVTVPTVQVLYLGVSQ